MHRILFLFIIMTMFIVPTAAEAAQIARVVTKVCATENPGFGSRVKCLSTTAPYGGGPMQVSVVKSVARDNDPITGDKRFYYQVRIPYRPNGRVGWIASERVQVFTTPYRIQINRAQRRATLYKNGKVDRRWRVVVGKSSTPTPSGFFAIYGKTDRPHSFDGVGILPFAYSNVHKQFDGGPGMLAIHGRSGASLSTPTGTAASNGCVQSDNYIVKYLLRHVPVGTPVRVV